MVEQELRSISMSSASFGIHSEMRRQGQLKRIRTKRRQVNIAIGATTIFLVTCTICLIILHISSSQSEAAETKIKKVVLKEHQDQHERLDSIRSMRMTAGPANSSHEDVVLLPEHVATDRSDEHPNHRYEALQVDSKEELMQQMMDRYYRSGWGTPDEPRAEEKAAVEGSLNSIQDIIKQYEKDKHTSADSVETMPSVQAGKQFSTSVRYRPASAVQGFHSPVSYTPGSAVKGFDSPVSYTPGSAVRGFDSPVPFRLKGVYVRPASTNTEVSTEQPQTDLNMNDPGQINQLLGGHHMISNMGSPFSKPAETTYNSGSELYTRAIYHPYDPQQASKEMRKKWSEAAGSANKSTKKKPLTVMLDIYPMNKPPEEEVEATQPSKQLIYVPIRPGQEMIQPQIQAQIQAQPMRHLYRHLTPPQQRRLTEQSKKRMVMQLNLFPKYPRRDFRRRKSRQDPELYHAHTDARIGEVFQQDPNSKATANRRTFSFFKKKKFDHDEPCDIIGHNPHGRPITAKWKNKNGEWIHAKFVALKEWDEGLW